MTVTLDVHPTWVSIKGREGALWGGAAIQTEERPDAVFLIWKIQGVALLWIINTAPAFVKHSESGF